MLIYPRFIINRYRCPPEDEAEVWRPTSELDDPAPLPEAPPSVPATPQAEAPQEAAKTSQSDPPPPPALPETSVTELDPELLSALGEATDSGPKWGPEIHSNLSLLWLPLLKKGMEKETKEKLLKQYTIPSNCTLLQAPKLNIEISSAVIEMVRMRDKKVEGSQQQLGVGITAVSRALSLLLTSDNKLEAIKILSDGCRILCDLHHSDSQARIKMITPGLAKPFLNLIQESERDETLFGTDLPEKIKASKTIEKQGLQIKKSAPAPRPVPSVASTVTTRQPLQGNWTASLRYPANRGGRGGQRRLPTSSRRPAPSTSTQYRANHSKPRAPARQ